MSTSARYASLRTFFRRHPSAILLVAQLLGLLIYPAMEGTTGGRAAYEVFGIVVLCLAIVTVRQTRVPVALTIVNGVAAAGFSIAGALTNETWLVVMSSSSHALFYFIAGVALVDYMLRDFEVTRDELIAVAATFTLFAWAFAYLFQLVQALSPGSFTAAVDPEGPRSWIELLFLSFTNLSSTGLSDVVPVRGFARGVTMIEQLAGLVYLAVLTSYLVGLTMRRAAATADRKAKETNE
ncbi:ion channel [Cumulibacter manganitolerans]|uniref:ion channel n=1 Tax=Cumulibacter manganitolerans TaxID=1884992 RepID=UPI001E3769B1|nr:ion channel [Cumulibacter manganitolerans]